MPSQYFLRGAWKWSSRTSLEIENSLSQELGLNREMQSRRVLHNSLNSYNLHTSLNSSHLWDLKMSGKTTLRESIDLASDTSIANATNATSLQLLQLWLIHYTVREQVRV